MVLVRPGDPADILGGRRVLPELLHHRRGRGCVREEEPGCSLHELHHELTKNAVHFLEWNGKADAIVKSTEGQQEEAMARQANIKGGEQRAFQ